MLSISEALGHDYALFGVPLPERCSDPVILASYERELSRHPESGPTSPYTQAWLRLRYEAMLESKPFSTEITPVYIENCDERLCVVSGVELVDDPGAENGWFFTRVCRNAPFERGSLIAVSKRIRTLTQSLTHEEILTTYAQADRVPGLSWQETEILACMVAHCAEDRFVLTKFKYPHSLPDLGGFSLTVAFFIQWGLFKSLYTSSAVRKVVWERMGQGLSRHGQDQVARLQKAMTERFIALDRKAAKPWMIFDDENCWKQFRIFWRIACAEGTLDPVFADFTKMFCARNLAPNGLT